MHTHFHYWRTHVCTVYFSIIGVTSTLFFTWFAGFRIRKFTLFFHRFLTTIERIALLHVCTALPLHLTYSLLQCSSLALLIYPRLHCSCCWQIRVCAALYHQCQFAHSYTSIAGLLHCTTFSLLAFSFLHCSLPLFLAYICTALPFHFDIPTYIVLLYFDRCLTPTDLHSSALPLLSFSHLHCFLPLSIFAYSLLHCSILPLLAYICAALKFHFLAC